MKGWVGTGGSALEDIQDNLSTLRTRSRDLYMGVPLATGALKTYRTNVVGSGLTPKPVVDAEALGIPEEQAEALEKQIAREFALWADSVECDNERMSNFYGIQKLTFLSWLQNGDVFAVLPLRKKPTSPYQMTVQLVEADRVSTPGNLDGLDVSDGKIVGGVEVDETGGVVAYHICDRHPYSYRSDKALQWRRVEAFGRKTGRRNILHITTRERVGQRRGVPLLAPVIESLKQLGRYTDAELVAAVVNGYFSVFIEKEDATELPPIGEQAMPEEALVDSGDENTVELGAGTIIDLAPGEKANPVAPGRPNTNFDSFVTSIAKQIGAALELPYELLMKQFTASYSASRAALLEAWKSFSMWRDDMIDRFCQPVYEEWLAEAAALGRIDAPGFFRDPAIRKAYAKAEWYGPTQGQLDPTKEVDAAEKRVEYGFSTRTKEAMELTGTDFRDNVKNMKRENDLLREATGQEEP